MNPHILRDQPKAANISKILNTELKASQKPIGASIKTTRTSKPELKIWVKTKKPLAFIHEVHVNARKHSWGKGVISH